MNMKFKLSIRGEAMTGTKAAEKIDDRVTLAAEIFNIHPRDLIGQARFAFLLLPRYGLAKALRMTGLSCLKVGKIVKRDHTSVLHQIDRAEYYMEKYPKYKAHVNNLYLKFAELNIYKSPMEEG